jgi:predicted Na+-dependent transporter
MTQQQTGLDDPRHASHAWGRFRVILWGMAATAAVCSALAVALLWWINGPMPWLFVGFTVAGVWATIMMAALLMGLMFLSSGTGHDDHIDDRVSKDVLDKQEQ